MKKISYSGKKVSLGIDVHAGTYHVTCVVSGEVVKRASMKGEPGELLRFISGHFSGANVITAYEAGFSGFELHRILASAGIKSLVVHAGSVEVASRDRVKTDKRDSQKLAIQLDAGRLKCVRVPSREEEAARVLHRTREQLVCDRSALMAQIRMRFYQFGYRVTAAKEQLTFLRVEKGLQRELPEEVRIGRLRIDRGHDLRLPVTHASHDADLLGASVAAGILERVAIVEARGETAKIALQLDVEHAGDGIGTVDGGGAIL